MRQTQADGARRGTQVAARGVLKGIDSSRKMQTADVSILKDERKDAVEHWEGYGLTAAPLEGAEALIVFPQGERSHAIVVAVGDRRYRLKGLQGGEVALYDHQGQVVKLGADGVDITSSKKVTVTSEAEVKVVAPKVTVEAAKVYLGGEAGAVAVITEAGPSSRVFAVV